MSDPNAGQVALGIIILAVVCFLLYCAATSGSGR